MKILIECEPQRGGRVKWYGHITHVPGGERRYLKDLSGIKTFIAPYLQSGGVELRMRHRAVRWVKQFAYYIAGKE